MRFVRWLHTYEWHVSDTFNASVLAALVLSTLVLRWLERRAK